MQVARNNISIYNDTGIYGSFRVPEEKQMMFLPDILEEEEEEGCKGATPRTSTASLSNPNESPVNERR